MHPPSIPLCAYPVIVQVINNHMHMLTENKDDLSKVSEDLVKQINYLTIFLIDYAVKTSDAVAEIKEKVDDADNSGMKKKLQSLAQISSDSCILISYISPLSVSMLLLRLSSSSLFSAKMSTFIS